MFSIQTYTYIYTTLLLRIYEGRFVYEIREIVSIFARKQAILHLYKIYNI